MKRGPEQLRMMLPNINGVSEAVRGILMPLDIRYASVLDIRVGFCLLNTFCHMLVHHNHPVPLEQWNGVACNIPCDAPRYTLDKLAEPLHTCW